MIPLFTVPLEKLLHPYSPLLLAAATTNAVSVICTEVYLLKFIRGRGSRVYLSEFQNIIRMPHESI